MQITVTFDQAVGTLPTAFVSAVNAAAQFIQSAFTDAITFNLHVGYGEVQGSALGPGTLGSSSYYLDLYSYSQIRTALANRAVSADDSASVATLPSTDPTSGGHFWVPEIEALALGLLASATTVDGYVGFSKTASWDFNRSDGISSNAYDFAGVFYHEITEVMGRSTENGGTIGATSNSYSPADLFHFSAPGVRDFSGTQPGYFSIDGGTTNLDNFNTDSRGDFGDWAASAGNDAFLAFSSPGVQNVLSATDLRVMDVLGFHLAASTPTASPPATGPTPTATAPTPTATPTPAPQVVNDFDHNGTSDVLLSSPGSGAVSIWELSAGHVGQALGLATLPSGYQIAGTGDFNADGTADILIESAPAGAVALWEVTGGHLSLAAGLGTLPSGYDIAGTGDFNHDGTSDVLLVNAASATVALWQVIAGQVATASGLGTLPSGYQVAGTGDFNRDGTKDVLLVNRSAGVVALWEVAGAQVALALGVAPLPAGSGVVGVGDFNHDGTSDILLFNSGTRSVELWEMNAGHLALDVAVGTAPTGFQPVGIGDYNGDGTSDVLWHNLSNDAVAVWEMSNGHIAVEAGLGTAGQGWLVA